MFPRSFFPSFLLEYLTSWQVVKEYFWQKLTRKTTTAATATTIVLTVLFIYL